MAELDSRWWGWDSEGIIDALARVGVDATCPVCRDLFLGERDVPREHSPSCDQLGTSRHDYLIDQALASSDGFIKKMATALLDQIHSSKRLRAQRNESTRRCHMLLGTLRGLEAKVKEYGDSINELTRSLGEKSVLLRRAGDAMQEMNPFRHESITIEWRSDPDPEVACRNMRRAIELANATDGTRAVIIKEVEP
jgi:hypothetical protein